MRVLAIVSAVLWCAACGRSDAARVHISAVVSGQIAGGPLTRVTVSVSPGGVTTDLAKDATDAAGGRFVGTLSVPAGPRTVKGYAFAGSTVVATGSADITAVGGQATQIQVTLLAQATADPVVTSLVVPSAARVGDVLALLASATNPSEDPMTFAWSATPAGCGTFSATGSLSTNFTARAAGTCTVRFSATAGGRTDSREADIEVTAADSGAVDVVLSFVPHPLITSIAFSAGGTPTASVDRTAADATIRAPFHTSTKYTVTISFDPAPDGAVDLADSCSGTIVQPNFVANASSATATWTPTVGSGACILTARLARQTLVDTFPIVVLPVP